MTVRLKDGSSHYDGMTYCTFEGKPFVWDSYESAPVIVDNDDVVGCTIDCDKLNQMNIEDWVRRQLRKYFIYMDSQQTPKKDQKVYFKKPVPYKGTTYYSGEYIAKSPTRGSCGIALSASTHRRIVYWRDAWRLFNNRLDVLWMDRSAFYLSDIFGRESSVIPNNISNIVAAFPKNPERYIRVYNLGLTRVTI